MDETEEEVAARSFHESDYHDSGRRIRKKRRLSYKHYLCCLCYLLSLAIAIASLVVTFLAKERPITSSMNITSSLTSTQTLHIKSLYCTEVELVAVADTDSVQANMYLLEEAPDTFVKHNYQVNVTVVIGNASPIANGIAWFESTTNYVTWMLHLNPDSEVNLKGCISKGDEVVHYFVIQGKDNYNYWKYEQLLQDDYLLDHCSSNSDWIVPFSSKEADQYFFVLMAPQGGQPTLDLEFDVKSNEYLLEGYSGLPNCTAKCSLKSPVFKYHYALFEVLPLANGSSNQSVPYGLGIELVWVCHTREWAYILVFCFFFLCSNGVLCLFCCCCYCFCCLLCNFKGNSLECQPLIDPHPFHPCPVAKIGPSTSPHYTHKPRPTHPMKINLSKAGYSAETQFSGL